MRVFISTGHDKCVSGPRMPEHVLLKLVGRGWLKAVRAHFELTDEGKAVTLLDLRHALTQG